MKDINPMKLIKMVAIAGVALSLFTTGCERTISHTEETKVKRDGTVESKEKKVTENPDGTVTKEEKKTTEKP